MLFNTLEYAAFFGVVLVCVWLLVGRRHASLVPWCLAAAAIAGTERSVSSGAVALGALLVSGALCAGGAGGDGRRRAVASVVVNALALAFVTWRAGGAGPLGKVVASLGGPDGALPGALVGVVTGAALAALVVGAPKPRVVFLLIASYVFYAFWDWRFLPLIWGSSTLDWWLGRRIGAEQDPARRRRWLAVTVVANLSVLGFFKYFDFGVENARVILAALGMHPPEIALRVALPVGISFFTFESMSYVIDVYRRDLEPHGSYLEYLCFVAFFPHLVAGPIVRPRDLLPQLGGPARFGLRDGSEGCFLIAVGLLKKVTIGDYLAINLVDRVFDAPFQYSALECYAAVVGYALQIYTDFSGYTDVAIGSALLLGVRMPLNFDAPYKAANIQDFWRRWHISLSAWLRDYLYVPLGGNRRGRGRTYVNLLLTMLLGGLWHGASWTFVVWGGLHGAALAAHRRWHERRAPGPAARGEGAPAAGAVASSPALRVAFVLLTFHFVCACWVFFRAPTFGQAWLVFSQLGTLTTFHPNLGASVIVALGVGLATHWAPEAWYRGVRDGYIALPAPAQAALLFGVAIVLRRMASAESVPFVYFQF